MARAILAFPEEDTRDVIMVVRKGLNRTSQHDLANVDVYGQLAKWCEEQEEYLNRDR